MCAEVLQISGGPGSTLMCCRYTQAMGGPGVEKVFEDVRRGDLPPESQPTPPPLVPPNPTYKATSEMLKNSLSINAGKTVSESLGSLSLQHPISHPTHP